MASLDRFVGVAAVLAACWNEWRGNNHGVYVCLLIAIYCNTKH